jgi:hypothetical protein
MQNVPISLELIFRELLDIRELIDNYECIMNAYSYDY